MMRRKVRRDGLRVRASAEVDPRFQTPLSRAFLDPLSVPQIYRSCYDDAVAGRQSRQNFDAILVLTAEASYHAPYDHCTVRYLEQAGVKPTAIRLADSGIRGNSHVMMLEKNNKDIAAVIAQWLDKTLAAGK